MSIFNDGGEKVTGWGIFIDRVLRDDFDTALRAVDQTLSKQAGYMDRRLEMELDQINHSARDGGFIRGWCSFVKLASQTRDIYELCEYVLSDDVPHVRDQDQLDGFINAAAQVAVDGGDWRKVAHAGPQDMSHMSADDALKNLPKSASFISKEAMIAGDTASPMVANNGVAGGAAIKPPNLDPNRPPKLNNLAPAVAQPPNPLRQAQPRIAPAPVKSRAEAMLSMGRPKQAGWTTVNHYSISSPPRQQFVTVYNRPTTVVRDSSDSLLIGAGAGLLGAGLGYSLARTQEEKRKREEVERKLRARKRRKKASLEKDAFIKGWAEKATRRTARIVAEEQKAFIDELIKKKAPAVKRHLAMAALGSAAATAAAGIAGKVMYDKYQKRKDEQNNKQAAMRQPSVLPKFNQPKSGFGGGASGSKTMKMRSPFAPGGAPAQQPPSVAPAPRQNYYAGRAGVTSRATRWQQQSHQQMQQQPQSNGFAGKLRQRFSRSSQQGDYAPHNPALGNAGHQQQAAGGFSGGTKAVEPNWSNLPSGYDQINGFQRPAPQGGAPAPQGGAPAGSWGRYGKYALPAAGVAAAGIGAGYLLTRKNDDEKNQG